ncbi:hypothetical protein BC937DRAFT_87638 [Endogone sp. FLAS-F59071]|nr:hypothetical protein BC937DRAFT_87638 [Endogone sp. FLAS-F59071]|eukprot:RUS22713.1 hypothetical protein BC937DRAFT_87638 [Endogone sp. FLAS-F59071]
MGFLLFFILITERFCVLITLAANFKTTSIMGMLEQNYKTFCSTNNMPLEDPFDIKAKVIGVLESTGLAETRAAKCDIDDFLKNEYDNELSSAKKTTNCLLPRIIFDSERIYFITDIQDTVCFQQGKHTFLLRIDLICSFIMTIFLCYTTSISSVYNIQFVAIHIPFS